jgi:hypothetical protein
LFHLAVEGEETDGRQITVAIVIAIKKGELLLAVCRIVRGIQIDGDSAGTAMQPFAMALDDAVGQGLAQAKQFLAIGAFSKRDNVGCEAKSSPSIGSRPTKSLCTGSQARRAASLASSYPKAMPITRCVSSSSISCKILPGCRSSCRQAANAEVRPNLRSAALSRTAPPSELPCCWSNFATTGRSKISGKRKQSVVVCSVK